MKISEIQRLLIIFYSEMMKKIKTSEVWSWTWVISEPVLSWGGTTNHPELPPACWVQLIKACAENIKARTSESSQKHLHFKPWQLIDNNANETSRFGLHRPRWVKRARKVPNTHSNCCAPCWHSQSLFTPQELLTDVSLATAASQQA